MNPRHVQNPSTGNIAFNPYVLPAVINPNHALYSPTRPHLRKSKFLP